MATKLRKDDGTFVDADDLPVADTAKVYIAKINQSGTNAPTATIFKNTLGGTPVLSRSSVGLYNITLNGAFPTARTHIICNVGNGNALINFAISTNDNTISLQTISETDYTAIEHQGTWYITVTVYPA